MFSYRMNNHVVRITVYHIEDDPLWAEVVGKKIGGWPEMEYLGSSETGIEGLRRCQDEHPNTVLVDLCLPDIDGLLLIDELSRIVPPSSIVLLTSRADDFTLFRAMGRNVRGLIWKSAHFDGTLRAAINTVAGAATFFPQEVREALQVFRSSGDAFYKILSERELEILPSLARGESNELIASRTGLASTTVKSHRVHILHKLGLNTTCDLIRWAAEKGFVSFHGSHTCFARLHRRLNNS
jgi:DNA-binding NarL/FixJ family response regulator